MPTKGDKTRGRIVAQAMQLFSVKGFYGTSIQDVMESVELTKGGLYGHFRSKEAIWDAAYEEAVCLWRGTGWVSPDRALWDGAWLPRRLFFGHGSWLAPWEIGVRV